MKRKCLAVGIILLFVGTCIIPPTTSKQTLGKTVITVDDEPGDADYISIKDAVNHSNPGDEIEIYSGTYYEEGIIVNCNNTTIIGIAEELGQGNDTGKPFIQGNGNDTVLNVAASHVVITNLRIENVLSGLPWTDGLYIGIGTIRDFNNITITNISVRNCTACGIAHSADGNDIVLTHNDIQKCKTGMAVSSLSKGTLCSNNTIIDCSNGIQNEGNNDQFSDNIIRRCSVGINFYQGHSSLINRNHIVNCSVGIYLWNGAENIITENNFINYSKNELWWRGYRAIFFSLWSGKKDVWKNNYWGTWNGKGPQPIHGTRVITILFVPFPISISVKWLAFDWHPAQEPYDIPGMS